ncbi:MAG: 30S ribosomal protein S7 [Armatimonadetes bacterium]|nr:30S ribosomal protein S7 [Armatimonadota bacterium]
MPRRGPAPLRQISPDPLFGSVIIHKLINRVMKDGKKTVAERIVYGALERIADATGDNPLHVLRQALTNVMPELEVRPRRVGGQTYQVPMEVGPRRRLSLALRWIVQAARQRPERGMIEKLARELMDAARNEGGAIKKRDDTHRMAEANKAFAHYRW